MWLMLQQDEPRRLRHRDGAEPLGTGARRYRVGHVGLDWEDHVRVDESLLRGKAELHDLVGDSTKARERFGWSPTIDFEGLVHLLVDTDLERLRARLEPAETLADD